MRGGDEYARTPVDASALTAWDGAALVWLTWVAVGDVCVILMRFLAPENISLQKLVMVVWVAAALVALAAILVIRLMLECTGRGVLVISVATALGTTLSLTLTATAFPIAAAMGLASAALSLPLAGWLWKRLPNLASSSTTGFVRMRVLVIVSAASPFVAAALLWAISGPDAIALAVWPALAGSMTALMLVVVRRIVDS